MAREKPGGVPAETLTNPRAQSSVGKTAAGGPLTAPGQRHAVAESAISITAHVAALRELVEGQQARLESVLAEQERLRHELESQSRRLAHWARGILVP